MNLQVTLPLQATNNMIFHIDFHLKDRISTRQKNKTEEKLHNFHKGTHARGSSLKFSLL